MELAEADKSTGCRGLMLRPKSPNSFAQGRLTFLRDLGLHRTVAA